MGNCSTSCFKFKTTKSKTAKLVNAEGQVSVVKLPTTVAEIMLENPGFALSAVDDLKQTCRISVIKADDVLHGRKVYVLVPVDKVNSRLSDIQLAAIDSVVYSCNENVRRPIRAGSKVSPVTKTDGSGESLEELMKGLSEKCTGLADQRNGFGKVWAPVFEPILEVC